MRVVVFIFLWCVCVCVVVAASCVTGVLPVLTLQREPQVVREGCACG